MTREKLAQDMNYNYHEDDSFYSDDSFYDDSYVDYDENYDKDGGKKNGKENGDEELVVLEFDDPDAETIVFELPEVPGAPDAGEIFIDDNGDIEVSDDDNIEVEKDPWDWQSLGIGSFLSWLKGMMDNVPSHSGYDIGGLERTIAYFERLLKEITKAMRQDYRGEIDVALVEDGRDKIEDGIQRMIDRMERIKSTKYKRYGKKTAWYEEGDSLIKTAQKATKIDGIVITVPLFISRIARVLINGTISAGHDMEEMYERLKKEYDLTKREEAEVQQLLADMGYPVFQDRGLPPGEQLDKTRSDNFDFAAQFNS